MCDCAFTPPSLSFSFLRGAFFVQALSDAASKCSQNTKERFDRPIRKFLKEDMQHVSFCVAEPFVLGAHCWILLKVILEAVNLVEKMSQTVHQKTFIASTSCLPRTILSLPLMFTY